MVRMIAPFGNAGCDACANALLQRPLTPNAAPAPRTPSSSRLVMLMAGQSNMSGPFPGPQKAQSFLFMTQVFADLALARRLERTEGRGNAAFVDAQARLDPSSGAIWK